MWNSILSGLRMFILTPFFFALAIVGIMICIIRDLNLLYFQTSLGIISISNFKRIKL